MRTRWACCRPSAFGSTQDGEEQRQGEVLRCRAVEIKHGRFLLYACIGYFVRENSKLSGYLSPSIGINFSNVPNDLVAFLKVPLAGWLQIVALCGLIEKHRLHLHAAE